MIPEEEIFSFLAHRKGLLDGVAVTGGEPTLQRDLPEFLRKIKALGFAVKLDTNGTNPAMLRAILSEKLADYVAMDIKAGRENYSAVTGTLRPGLAAVEECARMLMNGDTDFEFRTTVVRGLHSAEDFADIAAWLPGNEKYFLQAFKDSGDVISGGCAAFTREEMESFRAILLPAIPNARSAAWTDPRLRNICRRPAVFGAAALYLVVKETNNENQILYIDTVKAQ